jgi:rfaE bifunctional protein nucleotidyltransferase chain/domain
MKNSLPEVFMDKIHDLPALLKQVIGWKDGNEKIVFTNGVFDIIHIGHVSYLAKAKELGNKLVIGLNADTSVRRLKGSNRPLNSQENRAGVLAALFFVDAVVIFEEDTPLNVITAIMPDVLVKGADYAIDNIVGGKEVLANGGRVETVSFIDGFSSTNIIEKIQAMDADK